MPDWNQVVEERLARAKLDPASEAALIEELTQHMDDRYEELRASGVPGQECWRRVIAELDRLDPPD